MRTLAAHDQSTARWARHLLFAVNASVILAPIGYALVYSRAITKPELGAVPVVLGLGIAALHGRHTLAATRGRQPRHGLWTLALLALLVYPPLLWIGLSWGITQTTLIASALIVLPRRTATVAVGLVLLAAASYSTYAYWGRGGVGRLVFDVSAALAFDAIVGIALYGAARLVRVLYEVESTQAELAAIAAGRERLRVSRDLHDLLGQSLSAVALRGDLALRLVGHDESGAREEIRTVEAIARDALRGAGAVTRDEHVTTLGGELAGGAELLRAAGLRTSVDVNLTAIGGPSEAVLAWAVREGVTNVLRHSGARACTIRGGRHDGRAWLEIVNDGASGPVALGTGLTGLRERARACSGSLSAGPSPDGSFRLYVEVPHGEGL